ncbi:MAG: glycosyltransferase [Chloroflexi bacterium]|nr:glycosyltransferase [Chloroflexota bacterium]
MMDLVCISHLRWDFVWQRPQHLLSRLARHYRVFFVEEPVALTGAKEPRLVVRHQPHDVTVVNLLQPVEEDRWIGHNDPLTAETYQELLRDYLRQQGSDERLMWLYTPMAWHFAEAIPHRTLIYDVMDELSAFKGASPLLRDYDKRALSEADIVFTGGLSLYRSRQNSNPNTHLFPSGVEIEHFARAAQREDFPRPADLADVQGPVLGYYGVIDERMDLPLLAQMAEARPDWQIVLIGPVVKIDPSSLPQAPNLHYLGMKDYQALPAYLAHFDVALIPFAINESTRYLSPTKTLEYMAAHKPVVSTPIEDVVALYGQVVHVGCDAETFIARVEAALTSDPAARRTQEQKLLAQHTWDGIVQRMQTILHQTTQRKLKRLKEKKHEYAALA